MGTAEEAAAESVLLFDHLGLIVPEITTGREFLASALGVVKWTPVVEDDGLGVRVQFGASGPPGAESLVYELVAPLGDCSPIANALRSGKHILNHVAYRTADLEQAAARLRAQGCCPAGEPRPAVAYCGQRVQFFVSPLRFIIELIEKPVHVHAFEALQDAPELQG